MNTAYHDITAGQTEPVVEALTVEQLNQAKQLAQQSKQPLLKVLEEVSDLSPDLFVQALGLLVHYPVLTISQLYHLQPDFDVVSFTQAEKIGCVAVRDKKGALYLVHANPFQTHLYSKLDLLVNESATWALAHTEDLNVYLSHHEANMRALGEEVATHHHERQDDEQGIEDISLRSISEDTSPIVKFVRSTLYDA